MALPRTKLLLLLCVLFYAIVIVAGRSYYEVLQVSKEAPDEQIKMRKLYKKLMLMRNPMTSVKENVNSHSTRVFSDRKWIIPFLANLLISITLLFSAIFG